MSQSLARALAPINADSLKDVFIKRFEQLILSGHYPICQRLPSERELAQQLGVSRPVVHEGLVDLAVRGLVVMKPRVGTFVADYRRMGSLALLNSLISSASGDLDPALVQGLLQLRYLLEVEAAQLAAVHHSEADLALFNELLDREAGIDLGDLDAVADLDFEFHHLLTLASGNPLFAMLIKSCEPAYKNLTRRFFEMDGMAKMAFDFHEALVLAIRERDGEQAVLVMKRLLMHGASVLAEAIGIEATDMESGR